ncbi:MAG: C-GCAxxG-C-C family protein [Chlorobium sp.]|uniref:C-GCAxxG-C-C family protein n=1 Tax=Chlorobium sp. TaxID=1095 RepID=UPI0025BAA512|nr:C-GCAxxG-C-C family protein [Chlorobium sp.]MCF8383337.1 C-GCAxxG-C-C family protein [Chlorobium sp.]
MTRGDHAVSIFSEGYNCAQSVLFAFSDDLGIAGNTALKISSGFGGGIGRMQEVCGAVTCGIMVIGARYGRGEGDDRSASVIIYAKTRELMCRFAERHGSCCCSTLLNGCELMIDEGRKSYSDNGFFSKVCTPCVRSVIEILEHILLL